MFQFFPFQPPGLNLEVNLACLSRIKVVASLHTWKHVCWAWSFTRDTIITSLPTWLLSEHNYFKQCTRPFPAVHPNDCRLGNGLARETINNDNHAYQQ